VRLLVPLVRSYIHFITHFRHFNRHSYTYIQVLAKRSQQKTLPLHSVKLVM